MSIIKNQLFCQQGIQFSQDHKLIKFEGRSLGGGLHIKEIWPRSQVSALKVRRQREWPAESKLGPCGLTDISPLWFGGCAPIKGWVLRIVPFLINLEVNQRILQDLNKPFSVIVGNSLGESHLWAAVHFSDGVNVTSRHSHF